MSDQPEFQIDQPGTPAHGVRDGLLQDLLAVSMLIEGARIRANVKESERALLLAEAAAALHGNIASVRALITRLRGETSRAQRSRPACAQSTSASPAAKTMRSTSDGSAARASSAVSNA